MWQIEGKERITELDKVDIYWHWVAGEKTEKFNSFKKAKGDRACRKPVCKFSCVRSGPPLSMDQISFDLEMMGRICRDEESSDTS